MERNLETTKIIIKILGLDLSHLKWCASHKEQSKRSIIIIQGESSLKVFEQHISGLEYNRTTLRLLVKDFMSLTSYSMKVI